MTESSCCGREPGATDARLNARTKEHINWFTLTNVVFFKFVDDFATDTVDNVNREGTGIGVKGSDCEKVGI